MSKIRVLYIQNQFPQISETYVKSEIEAVSGECEILAIGFAEADLAYKNHAPYQILEDWDKILDVIREFRPHVLHSHWLYNIWKIEHFARKANVPYTVRAHSFDVLLNPREHYPKAVDLINDDLCLGVLIFPFGRTPLEQLGVRADKLHDCYPVVNYRRFHDRSPNGNAVMNVGACLPKKRMEDFLELGAYVPGMELNLYALGYDVDKLSARNEAMGKPVRIIPTIEPEDMPPEYKKHRWLVYTASAKIGTVGWPMAVAEAQASGVGVCMANLRPDLREYVGPCGYLFNSVQEAADIVAKPFPEEQRQMGFEQAKKSDVWAHKAILLNLWRRAAAAPRPSVAEQVSV
jgi:hypothetical protein